jgi:hypothetical protein
MNRAPAIISAGCTAVALALLSCGCATAPSSTQHAKALSASCPSCTVSVVDQVPLPVSTDAAVARLDRSWTIVEHTCTCCEDQNTRYFAGFDFQDRCSLDQSSGLCCTGPSGSSATELVHITR